MQADEYGHQRDRLDQQLLHGVHYAILAVHCAGQLMRLLLCWLAAAGDWLAAQGGCEDSTGWLLQGKVGEAPA
jgi:hypothetical protein